MRDGVALLGSNQLFSVHQTRPLLVGECNPYGADPSMALYPYPEGSAGGRLCRLVLGLSPGAYLNRFDRANLCRQKWSISEARERAGSILLRDFSHLVLLGARACSAFNQPFRPFHWGREGARPEGRPVVILPHPSGRSRAWNDPGAFARARETLTRAGVLPAPPQTEEE